MAAQLTEKEGEAAKHVEVERDDVHKEIAIVKMNRAPKNLLNKDLIMELNSTLEELEKDDTCRGVILTSAICGVFCAGLDGTEMYQKSIDYTTAFWRAHQNLWLTLYGSKLAIVAALNGSSIAGGCMLAMSCDYRVMSEGPFGIGLPEVVANLVAPLWYQDLMVNLCGERQTELALGLGTVFLPDEALKIGLVDEVVAAGDVFSHAKKALLKWLKIQDRARILTKQMRRGLLLEKLRSHQEEDITTFNEYIHDPAFQEFFGKYLESKMKEMSSSGKGVMIFS